MRIEMRSVGLSLFMGLLLIGSSCATSPTPVPPTASPVKVIDGDLIRVGISNDMMDQYEYPATTLTGTGHFKIIDTATEQVVFNGTAANAVNITVNAQGFVLRNNTAPLKITPKGPLRIESAPGGFLKILSVTRAGVRPSYRGVLEITRGYSSRAKLSVVNILPIQQYLKAVVPNELPVRFGVEAVKAQSVAARNYALRPREKPWPQFDMCDSQMCQVYMGTQTENPTSNKALEDTEGLVAIYQGDLVLALYSSSHGGYGEAYSNSFSDPKTYQFPAPAIPYLTGGPDREHEKLDLTKEAGARKFWLSTAQAADSFDILSPHYRWERTFPKATLEAMLNQNLAALSKDKLDSKFINPQFKPGSSIGSLQKIEITERGVSGKAMAMTITGSKGVWKLQKELVIRKAFKANGRFLPSANIILTPTTGANGQLASLKINGGGFGHGVGMSQYGASYMAKHGYTFDKILMHYYHGAHLGTIPLAVGDNNIEPIRHSFRPKRADGTLFVKTDKPGGKALLKINEQNVSVNLPQQTNQFDVAKLLNPGDLNTITLYPDTQDPKRPIKAWIELYP